MKTETPAGEKGTRKTALLPRKKTTTKKTITKYKRTEDALRESEERYRSILDNIEDGYYEVDLAGRLTFFNDSFCRITGYAREELTGMHHSAYSSEETAKEVYAAFNKVYLTGISSKGHEYQIQTKDRGKVFVETSISLRKDATGNIIGFRGIVRDITDRKIAEEALRESEEKYRTILEEIDEGYFEGDLSGHLTLVNDAHARNLLYSKEDLIGMSFQQFCDENTADKMQELYIQVSQTGKPFKGFEAEFYAKDGAKRIVEFSGSLIRDQEGEVIGSRGISRDVTERKKEEEARRQEAQRYRTMIEDINECYFELDLQGHFTFVNDAQCRDLGYSREELIGLDYKQYQDEAALKQSHDIFANMYKTGQSARYVGEYIHRNGTKYYSEVYASLRRDAKGNPIGFRGISRNITDRVKAEDALRDSEEKYRQAFSSTSDIILILDKELKISSITPSVEKILGYTAEEMLRRRIDQLNIMTPATLEKLTTNILRTLSGEEVPNAIFEFIAEDGSVKFGDISASPIHKNGKVVGLIAIARDITERKRTEDALKQNEEKYRTIIETIQDGYLEIDLTNHYTFVNNVVSEHLGYSREELIGMSGDQIQDENSFKKANNVFIEILKTGKPVKSLELECIRKDKTKGTYDLSVSLMRDGNGQPIGFRSISRDITERKMMEDAIRQSEEKYRTIIETIQEGYMEMDLAGHYTFMNDVISEHLGYTREELIGTNGHKIQDEVNYKKALQNFNEIYRTGKPGKAFELECIRKDGTKGIYELSSSMIRDAQGKPIGFRSLSRDITERKKMEDTLRQSEERYRNIIENIQDGYFEIDLAGKYIFVNDIICQHLQRSQKELIGMDNRQFQTAENAKIAFQYFKDVLISGKSDKAFEMEVIRKDGSTQTSEVSISLIRNTQGQPIGFRGISRDVTERRKMEDAIRQSEEKYRNIIESIEDGYVEVALDGSWTFVNNVVTQHMLYSREELLGMDFHKLHTEQSVKNTVKAFVEVYQTGKPIKALEMEGVRKDGTIGNYELSVSLMKDASGQPIGFRCISRDISERKKMEEAIIKSEQNYRSIVENAQEGIFQTSPNDRQLTFNAAFAVMLGYDSPDDAAKSITSISHQVYVDADDYRKVLDIIRREGSIKGYETEFYRKDKSRIWVNMSISTIRDHAGELLYYHGIVEDITPKKKLVQERQNSIDSLRQSLGATIMAMSATVEARDPYTAGHQRRVADLARAVAREMNLSANQIDGIRMAGMIHDVGKISIPSEILTKPTRLTNLEMQLIRTHSEAGYNILKNIEFPWPIARIVLEHHERSDGSGYPNGLKGEDILLESKIIAVADVVEAISSNRPYRPALGIDVALDEIAKNSGTVYDAKVSEICIKLFREKQYEMPA